MELKVISEIYKELVKARLQMTQPIHFYHFIGFHSGFPLDQGSLYTVLHAAWLSEAGLIHVLLLLSSPLSHKTEVKTSAFTPQVTYAYSLAPHWSLHLQRLCLCQSSPLPRESTPPPLPGTQTSPPSVTSLVLQFNFPLFICSEIWKLMIFTIWGFH